jgi:hypothetical protein
MLSRAIALCILGSIGFAAHAQPPNPFLGSWKVTFAAETKKGTIEQREALLVVKADGGSWRVFAPKPVDPCAGQEMPLRIDRLTDDQLHGTVARSMVADMCKDQKLVLIRDEQGRVSGRLNQMALTLDKK